MHWPREREKKKKKLTLYSDCCGSKDCVNYNIAGPWSKAALMIFYMAGLTARLERFWDPHLKISRSLWQNVLTDYGNSSESEELEN